MEALIELGATNCVRSPSCFTCPLKQSCGAYAHDAQEEYPRKPKKAPPIILHRQVLLLESQGHFLVKKEKNSKKIMADLFEFPYVELDAPIKTKTLPKDFVKFFQKEISFVKELGVEKHTFTKYKAFLYPQHFISSTKPKIYDHVWVHKAELQKYPFSSGHRKIMRNLCFG